MRVFTNAAKFHNRAQFISSWCANNNVDVLNRTLTIHLLQHTDTLLTVGNDFHKHSVEKQCAEFPSKDLKCNLDTGHPRPLPAQLNQPGHTSWVRSQA